MSRKKAVFLYESKRMRWFALAGIIAGVLFTILMMHEFKGAFEDGSFYLGGGINFGFCKMLGSASILIVGCIAVMSIFQFSDWHKKSTQEYLLSLPFTQKERFLAKALCGYGTILLSGITVLLGMIYVRNCYITEFWKNLSGIAYSDIIMGNNTMWQLIQLGLQLILMMLALYSIFLLAHILVSRGIVAALIGTGMSFAPIYLWSVGYVLLYDGWFFREMQPDGKFFLLHNCQLFQFLAYAVCCLCNDIYYRRACLLDFRPCRYGKNWYCCTEEICKVIYQCRNGSMFWNSFWPFGSIFCWIPC